MALGVPADRASAGETTSDNQTVITTTSAIPAGHYIIATCISDAPNTTDGETAYHTALTVGTVALTKRREQTEGGASGTAAIVTSQWYGVNSGAEIAVGANVTLDLSDAVADKRIWVISGTRDTSKTFEAADGTSLAATNYVSAGSNDMVAQSTSGMTSEEHLHVRSAGCDSASTGFTGTATWTEMNTNRLVTGSNGVCMEYKISTSTGETSDPSSNAGNGTEWATILAAYREVTAGGTPTSFPFRRRSVAHLLIR